MKLAAFAGFTSLCAIAIVGSVGCGDAGPGSPTSSAALPKNGVYSVQLESNGTPPTCNSKTAGETAMVTSTDTLETCVLRVWVPIPCLVGGAVAFDSATDSLWACTENTDGGPALWAQITLPQGPPGATGPEGPKGATGPQGPPGDAGATGAMGQQGPMGPQGPQGDAGATGAAGPQGPAGTNGMNGANGATGANGPQGDVGANGANALIVQTPFAAGAGTAAQNAACPNGGTEIDTGTDDGTRVFAGTPTVTYGCNGATGGAGANGASALIVQTPFAAGAGTPTQDSACPNGGTEIDTGTSDGMGAFAGAVTTTYVCNGNSGATTVDTGMAAPFDWRDAIIYFLFVDRFFDGNAANDAPPFVGVTPSADYAGGDWAGVTYEIREGYFDQLHVNVLWITVPIKNADDVAELGTDGVHALTSYAGYWPEDPTTVEPRFGSAADLAELVVTAHTHGIKVLFDYPMADLHTESALYQQHQNDSPAWFTPSCVCGQLGCTDGTTCWATPYLAHYDFTNPAALTFSVNSAISLLQQNGNDGFRLDAVQSVTQNWLSTLRPAIQSQILAGETPHERFFILGDTEDFQNRALIASFTNPHSMLDGQLDYPLRIRLIESVLMRSTQNMLTPDDLTYSRSAPPGMTGLAQFMDSNDAFYPTGTVMATFLGNHLLPRSISYGEQTLPAWLSEDDPANPSASDGESTAWVNTPPVVEPDANAYQRLANAFAVIFTNKGAPLIYYGDEIGMEGAGDPDNRRLMRFGSSLNANQIAMLAQMQQLLSLRAAHPAMRRGNRTTLEVTEDLWVYSMATPPGDPTPDTVFVAVNRSDSDLTTTALPTGVTELVTGSAVDPATVTIPARQTRIFTVPWMP